MSAERRKEAMATRAESSLAALSQNTEEGEDEEDEEEEEGNFPRNSYIFCMIKKFLTHRM